MHLEKLHCLRQSLIKLAKTGATMSIICFRILRVKSYVFTFIFTSCVLCLKHVKTVMNTRNKYLSVNTYFYIPFSKIFLFYFVLVNKDLTLTTQYVLVYSGKKTHSHLPLSQQKKNQFAGL